MRVKANLDKIPANIRDEDKMVPRLVDMMDDYGKKIPFLGETVGSVNSRMFMHGIMLYMIETWETKVLGILKAKRKIPRTKSILRWSSELLSANELFDDFLDSGIILVSDTKKPGFGHHDTKCQNIFLAFEQYCKVRQIPKRDRLEKKIVIERLTKPNKLNEGFKIQGDSFVYMTYKPEMVEEVWKASNDTPGEYAFDEDDMDDGFKQKTAPEPQIKKTMTKAEMWTHLKDVKEMFDTGLIDEHEHQEMKNSVMDAFKAAVS